MNFPQDLVLAAQKDHFGSGKDHNIGPWRHVSPLCWCPAREAAKTVYNRREIEAGTYYYNRRKHIKMTDGSWSHEGMENWFLRNTPRSYLYKQELRCKVEEYMLVGRADLVCIPPECANWSVIDIKTGSGKWDGGYSYAAAKQVNLYNILLSKMFPGWDVKGPGELWVWQKRWNFNSVDMWLEAVPIIEIDVEGDLDLFELARTHIIAGKMPPKECLLPAHTDSSFERADKALRAPGFWHDEWVNGELASELSYLVRKPNCLDESKKDEKDPKRGYQFPTWQCSSGYCMLKECPFRNAEKKKKRKKKTDWS